jgi:hypothetical protein
MDFKWPQIIFGLSEVFIFCNVRLKQALLSESRQSGTSCNAWAKNKNEARKLSAALIFWFFCIKTKEQ